MTDREFEVRAPAMLTMSYGKVRKESTSLVGYDEYQQAHGTLRMRREAMAEARQNVRDAIEELRTMTELGLVNPDEYGAAEESLDDAWQAYREAAGNAFEAYSYARRYGIAWDDCAP